MTPDVTVVGSLNLDLVVSVARLPGRGETVIGTDVASLPGGKGANQAAAAAALSPNVAMVGRVGDDSAGHSLVDDLAARGVACTVSTAPGVVTGTATVAVESKSGENLIVVAPGANGTVTPADVGIDEVRSACVVLLQLEIPLPAVEAAAAHASGLVVLNPAPPAALPASLLARVDVLVPNEWELTRLAGVDPSPRAPDQLAALARTVTSGDVVVTMGARGALVVPRSAPFEVVAAPEVDTIDTTGAGDCFCAALCVALARGSSLLDAARYAVVAAALSTTGSGARGALPGHGAVLAAMAAC
jgi:ribokinase